MDQTKGEVQGIDGPILCTRLLRRSFVANAVKKKLDKHLNEQFHQRVSMDVTKRVSNIMKDPEL